MCLKNYRHTSISNFEHDKGSATVNSKMSPLKRPSHGPLIEMSIDSDEYRYHINGPSNHIKNKLLTFSGTTTSGASTSTYLVKYTRYHLLRFYNIGPMKK